MLSLGVSGESLRPLITRMIEGVQKQCQQGGFADIKAALAFHSTPLRHTTPEPNDGGAGRAHVRNMTMFHSVCGKMHQEIENGLSEEEAKEVAINRVILEIDNSGSRIAC